VPGASFARPEPGLPCGPMPRRKEGEQPIFSGRHMGRAPKNPFEVIDYRVIETEAGPHREPVTAMDRIEETLRSNGFIHDAAARAGLATETLRTWRAKGVRAQAAVLNGRRRTRDLTVHEQRCVELARRMERAEADAKLALTALLTRASQGGLQQVRIIEQVDPDTGVVLSRRQETITLPRDIKAAMWLLSHRYPVDFAGRVVVTGPEGGPLQLDVSPKEQLAEAVSRARERLDGEVGASSGNGEASAT
jgi:hypothetical protein